MVVFGAKNMPLYLNFSVEKYAGRCERQILPLRGRMTTKKAAAKASSTADPFGMTTRKTKTKAKIRTKTTATATATATTRTSTTLAVDFVRNDDWKGEAHTNSSRVGSEAVRMAGVRR
jgi:hypothetical protein